MEMIIEYPGIDSIVETVKIHHIGIYSAIETVQIRYEGFDMDEADTGNFLLFAD